MPRKNREEESETIGVKVAGLKERTVQECLNCERPAEYCKGCPIYERDIPIRNNARL